MRKQLFAVLGFVAAGALAFLLFRPESAESSVRPPAERQMMPEIRMKTLDGASWKLADTLGKVVLLNFWASWCPPCRMETPALIQVANEYRGRGLETVGVTMDDNIQDARRFVAGYKVPYTVLLPGEDALAAQIEALPTTYLLDRQGRVAHIYTGAVSESTLRRDIGAMLAE